MFLVELGPCCVDSARQRWRHGVEAGRAGSPGHQPVDKGVLGVHVSLAESDNHLDERPRHPLQNLHDPDRSIARQRVLGVHGELTARELSHCVLRRWRGMSEGTPSMSRTRGTCRSTAPSARGSSTRQPTSTFSTICAASSGAIVPSRLEATRVNDLETRLGQQPAEQLPFGRVELPATVVEQHGPAIGLAQGARHGPSVRVGIGLATPLGCPRPPPSPGGTGRRPPASLGHPCRRGS